MFTQKNQKKGLDLARYAKADTQKGAVHLAGKSSPTINLPFILENVKDIPEFTKRISVKKINDTDGGERSEKIL